MAACTNWDVSTAALAPRLYKVTLAIQKLPKTSPSQAALLSAVTFAAAEGNTGCFFGQSLRALRLGGSSGPDFSPAGISPAVLHSPPAGAYKAVHCSGLIENCLYQNYSVLRGFQEGLGNYMDNEKPQLGQD